MAEPGGGDYATTETKPEQQRDAVTERQGERERERRRRRGRRDETQDRRRDEEIRNEEVTCE